MDNFIGIAIVCLFSSINFSYCIPMIDQTPRRFFDFPKICNFGGFKRRSLSMISVSIEHTPDTDSTQQFWSPLNYTDISKRAERHFADTKTTQSDSSITNIYLVPKSSFEEFKRCNVSSLSLSIMDAMGLGQSLMKVPSLVGGGSKLHVIPVLKPIDSLVPEFIVENITVLFYDNDALVTDGSFSAKNHKLFDSIWASAVFQSSSSSYVNDSSANNSYSTTDYNFVMFNNSQLSPTVADALSLSWALNTYK